MKSSGARPEAKKRRVLVAMSGGVDSSVAAYLLKEAGYDVIGATMKTKATDACQDTRAKGCCSIRDLDDARSVAGRLGIPYYVLDLSKHFKEEVIDYFMQGYLEAKTPNPCIQCNNRIKFGVFLDKARQIEADYVATGHYARREWSAEHVRWVIREAADPTKDQSYVLFGLDQHQLSKTLLPVGAYHKHEIRRMAEAIGLRVHDKPDSQEICFVNAHYGDFLQGQGIPLPGPGNIVDLDGRIVGRHPGYHLYTIGQRRGLAVRDSMPRYVVRINTKQNEVIVGSEADLFSRFVRIEKMNWILPPRLGGFDIKIRSRNQRSRGQIISSSQGEAVFKYDTPEKAVTPGQAAVLYDGGTVVGGGWIREA